EAAVADEDIGSQPQQEKGYAEPPGGEDGHRQLVRRPRLVIEVGRPADAERRVWGQDLIRPHPVGTELPAQRLGGAHGASIIWIRRAWRPPSKGVSSQICTRARAVSRGIIRWPRESMLASLCWRARRADSSFQHRAQRTPRTRLATIASPLPEPPSTTPRSNSPRATASATGRMKSG